MEERENMDHIERTERKDIPEPTATKRAYVSPTLVGYGSIAKLTQAAGVTVEGMSPGMACL